MQTEQRMDLAGRDNAATPTPGRRPWRVASFLGLLALPVTFTFGFSYGNVANHQTCLLGGLHGVDPAFLRCDRLASETDRYLPVFAGTIIALDRLGSIPWGIAVLHVLLAAAIRVLVYRFLDDAERVRTLWTWRLVVALVLIDGTKGAADTHVCDRGLLASSIARVGLVAASWPSCAAATCGPACGGPWVRSST